MQLFTQPPRESPVKDKLKYVSLIFMTKPQSAESLRQITPGFSFQSQAGEIKRESFSGFRLCISFPSVQCLEGKWCCLETTGENMFYFLFLPSQFTIVILKSLQPHAHWNVYRFCLSPEFFETFFHTLMTMSHSLV